MCWMLVVILEGEVKVPDAEQSADATENDADEEEEEEEDDAHDLQPGTASEDGPLDSQLA